MRTLFLAAAAAELDEATTHYAQVGGQALAARFLTQIDGLLDLIAVHPGIGHADMAHVRRFCL